MEKSALKNKYIAKCLPILLAVGLLPFSLVGCSEKTEKPRVLPESVKIVEAEGANIVVEETIRIGYWIPESATKLPEWQLSERKRVWEQLLPGNVLFSDSSDLASLKKEQVSLVIVAYAEGFTKAEAAASNEFLQQGGNVFFNGWIGANSNVSGKTKEKNSFHLMKKVLQEKSIKVIPQDEAYFVSAGARNFLLTGIDPGQRLSMGIKGDVPAIGRNDSSLYWSDWSLRPRLPTAGATLWKQVGKGQLFWWAFSPENSIIDKNTSKLVRRVLKNMLAHADRNMIAEIMPWPNAAPLAGLLAMDTEDQFTNALNVTELLKKNNMPTTYFVLAGLAEQNPDLIPRIMATGEVGSHAYVHDGFKEVPIKDQIIRLKKSIKVLETLGVEDMKGFRPPYESYDENTLKVLVELGFDYIAGDLAGQSMAPRVMEIEGQNKSLVQIPRPAADDYELEEKGDLPAKEFLGIMLNDLDHAQRLSGLYYYSFHTQYFGTQERLGILQKIIDQLKTKNAWLASAGDIAVWWRNRENITAQIIPECGSSFRLIVKNHNPIPLNGASVRVHLPRNFIQQKIDITPNQFNSFIIDADRQWIDIVFSTLPADGEVSVLVSSLADNE